MIRRAAPRALLVAATLTLPALTLPAPAQQVDWHVLGEALRDTRPEGPEMSSGTHAMLRALDKVSGTIADIDVQVGGEVTYGRLSIRLAACRFPAETPTSDAFAYLQIVDTQRNETAFQGWMIASSPGLNALDHARYDVWVLSCA